MKIFFQILFFIILTILFAVLLLLFEAKFRVTKPEFVQNQLAKNNIYEKIINNSEFLVGEYIKKQTEKGKDEEGPAEGQTLDSISLEMAGFVKRNIEPVWLKGQFESLSNQVYTFVLSEKQETEFRIDISGLRSNFETEIKEFARKQFEKLPEVSEEEFQKMMQKEKFPKVRPRGALFEEVLARIPENPIDIILGKIPFNLKATTKELQGNPKANEALSNIERFRFAKRVSDIIFYNLFLGIILLVFLFAKLTSHTLRDFIQKIGFYLLPGFILFAVFSILRFMDNFLMNTFLLPRAKNVPAVLMNEFVSPVLKSSYKDITGDLMLWSSLLGFLGLLFLVPAFYKNFLESKNK